MRPTDRPGSRHSDGDLDRGRHEPAVIDPVVPRPPDLTPRSPATADTEPGRAGAEGDEPADPGRSGSETTSHDQPDQTPSPVQEADAADVAEVRAGRGDDHGSSESVAGAEADDSRGSPTRDAATEAAAQDDARTGWDSVGESPERPDSAAIHLPSDRREHILDGDASGGGHRAETGRPGKSEFPPEWSDDKIEEVVEDVARHPDDEPYHQPNGRWLVSGTRDGVDVKVVVHPDGRIWTAYPTAGPGVVKNPS